MMTLVRICGEHWHAVERDLLSLNWAWSRAEKKFSHMMTGHELSLWQLISVVVASPPGSAIYHAETRGGTPLTPEAQLLANLSEQQAGLTNLNARYQRPGADSTPVVSHAQPKVDSFAALPDYGGFKLDALPVDEMLAKRAELMADAQARDAEGMTSDTIVREKYNPFAKNGMGEFVVTGPGAA